MHVKPNIGPHANLLKKFLHVFGNAFKFRYICEVFWPLKDKFGLWPEMTIYLPQRPFGDVSKKSFESALMRLSETAITTILSHISAANLFEKSGQRA
jgi:hypothetical protein